MNHYNRKFLLEGLFTLKILAKTTNNPIETDFRKSNQL